MEWKATQNPHLKGCVLLAVGCNSCFWYVNKICGHGMLTVFYLNGYPMADSQILSKFLTLLYFWIFHSWFFHRSQTHSPHGCKFPTMSTTHLHTTWPAHTQLLINCMTFKLTCTQENKNCPIAVGKVTWVSLPYWLSGFHIWLGFVHFWWIAAVWYPSCSSDQTFCPAIWKKNVIMKS